MKIEELVKEVYEDLNAKITAIESNKDLTIYFECDDWISENLVKKFKITCLSAIESRVLESHVGNMDFTKSDPILWKHNEEHGYLYYTSEFDNHYELLGRLWEAHEKTFYGLRPLSEYINTYSSGQNIEFCKGSYGQLAQGPISILDIYKSAIAGKITTNIVRSYKSRGNYCALFFDDLFVVCKSVTVQELTN